MSTAAAPSAQIPPPPPYGPAAPAKPADGRTVPVVVGAALATVGTVLALGGGGVLAIAGTDGSLKSGSHEFATPTSALVSEVATIKYTEGVATLVGHPTVRTSLHAAAGGPDVFVGVGRASDVDRYLQTAPVDRVTDFEVDPFTITKEPQPGSATPKPPASQSFWVSRSSGRAPAIDWKVRDGDYRLVVMNADGSRRVVTDASFELKIPHLSTIALVGLLVGLGMIGAAVALLVPSIGGPRSQEHNRVAAG